MPTAPEDSANLERAIHDLRITVHAATTSQRELSDTMKELRTEISTIYVRKDVLDPTLKAITDDVNAHGEWITWATRIVIALVIAAVVGLALTQGGAPPS